MDTDAEPDRCKPPTDQSRELALVARKHAEHCLAIDLAVARQDFDAVCASVEMAKVLYQRIAGLYLQMLAARTTPTRMTERSSL